MSIINEALKKTEQDLQQSGAKNNYAASAVKTTPKPFLIYTLILLLSIFLGKFIFGFLGSKPQNKNLSSTKQTLSLQGHSTAAVQQPITAEVLPAKQELPAEEKKPAEVNFILNGIFVSDNDGYALVNNQIVRENDLVDGAKVVKITANTVELNNNGKLVSLSTGR